MRRLFATVGVLGLSAGILFGEPVPAPAPPTPAELVIQLGSDDFREREAAAAALEKAGAAAIPALREAMKSEVPEVRQRAAPLLYKLQRAADSTSRLTAKKVALNYKDTSLGTAVNDLKTRTGLNVALDPNRIENPIRKVTCVTGEVPVWEALDLFCAVAGLREAFQQNLEVPKVQIAGRRGYTPPPQVPNADSTPIVLIDGKHTRLPGDRATAVRVVALPPSFPGHRVTLGSGDTTLCFDITPAPGLNWVDVNTVKITKLIDEHGRFGGAGSVKPSFVDASDSEVVAFGGKGGVVFVPAGGRGGQFDPRTGAPIYPDTIPNPRVVAVPLKIGTPTARVIKRMEGMVLGEITLANQTLVTVADPTKNTGVAHDGAGQLRMTVVGITDIKGGGTAVQVLLEYPSPWSVSARRGFNPGGIWPESPARGNQMPVVHSFDSNGKPITATFGENYTDSSDDGLTMIQHMTLNYRKDSGTPAKLTVVGPRTVVVEVPFVMENVPLP
jgi:hypothetical protein